MFIALIFSGFGPIYPNQTINNFKVLQIYNLTIILLQYLVPHLNIVTKQTTIFILKSNQLIFLQGRFVTLCWELVSRKKVSKCPEWESIASST